MAQERTTKTDKRTAKRPNTNDITPHCDKCNQDGHSSLKSFLYPFSTINKAQVIRNNLGDNYKAFTRKVPSDQCIRDTFQQVKQLIITACSNVRDIVIISESSSVNLEKSDSTLRQGHQYKIPCTNIRETRQQSLQKHIFLNLNSTLSWPKVQLVLWKSV